MNNILNLLFNIVYQLDPTKTLYIIMLLLMGSFVFAYSIFNSEADAQVKREKKERKAKRKSNNLMSRFSDGTLTGKLIALSYTFPFSQFIDETEESKQAVEIKKKIVDAQLYNVITYRSFAVVQFLFAFFGLTFMTILMILFQNAPSLFPALGFTNSNLMKTKIFILIFSGIICVYPSLYLNSMAKSVKAQRTKDLPVLQLFLILSLKTGKSINEIFETLGTLNTRYKNIFKTAYLINLRNSKESYEYLIKEFRDTRFEFSIRALSNMMYYSRLDTVRMLENSLEDILADNKEKQEKKNLVNLFLTQGTLALPLVALFLLVLYPLLYYVITVLNNSLI